MAENQYIVETKFTADTEEFKEGAQEVQNELDKMNDKLTETEEATTVATESVEDFTEEVLENISIGKGWLSLLSTIISTFAVKFYSALTKGRKETKEINAAISSLNGTVEQAGWAATISVNRFNELRESWEKLSPDDKIAQFNDYKAALHDVNVEVASLNDLENKLVKDADKVASAIMARAKMSALMPQLAEAEVAKGVAETNLAPITAKMEEIQPFVEIERNRAALDPETPRTYRSQQEDLAAQAAPLEAEIRKSTAILDKFTPYFNQLKEEVKALKAEVEEGSIDALTNQLKNLETQFNATGDATKRAELSGKIKEVKDKIAELKGETENGGSPLKTIKEDVPPVVGSLDELNAALKTARENYNSAATDEMRRHYAAEIAGIEQTIDALNREAQAYLEIQKYKALGTLAPVTAGVSHDKMIGAFEGPDLDPSTSPLAQTLQKRQQTVIDAQAALQQHVDSYNETLSSMFGDAVAGSISNGIQALSDAVMGIGDIDASQVVAAFLQPFAQMAVSMGETLIASGIGAISLKKLLENPWTAIAAGTALVALGSIASSAIQKSINTATGSGGTGGGNTWTGGGQLAAATNTPLQIEVYGTLSGQDIVLAGNNYTNNQRR